MCLKVKRIPEFLERLFRRIIRAGQWLYKNICYFTNLVPCGGSFFVMSFSPSSENSIKLNDFATLPLLFTMDTREINAYV